MHRTEADNKIVVGGLNKYTNGPPGTTLDADETNTWQEELAYVIEQAGLTLETRATETNTQLKAAIDLQIATQAPDYGVDIDYKNLAISVATTETVTATCDRLQLLNSSNVAAYIDALSTTFNIATDLMAGTSEKSSHWYQLWIDSAGARLMVPDLVGVADANVPNVLSASAANFVTDLVKPGDRIKQTTDGTEGFVGSVTDANNIACVDADGNALDLFPLGTEGYEIRLLSPTGLGAYKARIGSAYNDSSGNITKAGRNLDRFSWINPLKSYSLTQTGGGGDVEVAYVSGGGSLTSAVGYAIPEKTSDGKILLTIMFAATVSSTPRTSLLLSISGVTFTANSYPLSFFVAAVAAVSNGGYIVASDNRFRIEHESATSTGYFYGAHRVEITAWPTWADQEPA